ncbi:hypothetical protein [Spirochaeta isovalerica]|uniref:Right handed beta helix domain-containing protein n=1 Tax=Spirochaeta isovalerica TaxID=150 RepID=A0A841RCE3_9SPIO|nr:hypothetical protein [Spirochaeta isovalerica]MBB6480338.1 hypothetical protein [Spirochaeta isovalerica]
MSSLNRIIIFASLAGLLISCKSQILPEDSSIEYAGPPQFIQSGGNTYYIDPSTGNDSNSGLDPAAAFASFDPVNTHTVPAGTTILLKRGEVFKGPLHPGSGEKGNYIRYGAYGVGEKPLITGADELTSGGSWIDQGAGLWTWSVPFAVDIGQIYFNGDAATGSKKWSSAELGSDGDFFFDRASGLLTLYSSADPLSAYSSILAARTEHIINFSGSSYVLFEDLSLRYGGAHGFGGGNTDHLIIQDCDFAYIGGGWLDGAGETVRYGNGIEFWGNASNHLVQRNTFTEIYDTALTNQNHTNQSVQHNIYYMNNIISRCGLASFEVWNRPSSSQTAHIYFIHNTSYNPGYGWGAERPDRNHFHIALFYHEAETDQIVIKGNIFYTSSIPSGSDYNFLLFDENPAGWFSEILLESNLWHAPAGPAFGINYILYDNLSEFAAATGKGAGGLWGEPLFTDSSTGDFSLAEGSPGKNLVPETEFRTSDFFGNPLSLSASAGAVQ